MYVVFELVKLVNYMLSHGNSFDCDNTLSLVVSSLRKIVDFDLETSISCYRGVIRKDCLRRPLEIR